MQQIEKSILVNWLFLEKGEPKVLLALVQTFFCHNYDYMAFQNVLHLRIHVCYSILYSMSSLHMTGLPCFLRRWNRRNWFPLCSHFFVITIIAMNIKMLYVWSSMFTIIYMYRSLYVTGLPCFPRKRNRRNYFPLCRQFTIAYMYSVVIIVYDWLPCFLRRWNRRNWFPLCSHFFVITIIAMNIKMLYVWSSMFTIIYMYSL